jgi:hypothetical protein
MRRLLNPLCFIGAGEGNRTLTYSLGSYRSTTELLPLGGHKLENSTRLAARARIARSEVSALSVVACKFCLERLRVPKVG